MASNSIAIGLREEVTCSICMEFFSDPVTIDCGHNFCRHCLAQYMGAKDLDISCPECKQPFKGGNLKTNKCLASIVEMVQQMKVQGEEVSHRSLCQKHGEKLQLFCETEGSAICLMCRESSTHIEHKERLIKEARDEYTDKLQGCLSNLREGVDGILEKRTRDEKAFERLKTQLRTEIKNVSSRFTKLHVHLREREQALLNELQDMEQKVAVSENAHLEKLSSQISDVNALMTEVEEMFKKPPLEILENAKTTLSKFESAMFWATEYLNKNHKVPVALDPDSASQWLILSEDGRRVTWTAQAQPVPDHPKRFVASECVLGTEGFTSGRHYWEMDFLSDVNGWSVGVAGQFVNRQTEIREFPDMGIWAVGKWGGRFRALTPSRHLLSLHQEPRKLVVYLDYEAGRLSLVNKDTSEHLYTFTDAAFSDAVYPYFKIWKTDLRLL